VVLQAYESEEELLHPYSTLAAIHEKEEEREEELRILYVALTRAKNEIYLAATIDPRKGPSSKSQFSRILAALSIDLSQLLTADSVTLVHQLSRFVSGEVMISEFVAQIPILRNIEPVKVEESAERTLPPSTRTYQLRPVPAIRGVTRYSPTQLLTYKECPTKYFLRYDLGFPEQKEQFAEFEPAEESNSTSAALYGTLLHAAFERIEKPNFILSDELFVALAFTAGIAAEQGSEYRKRLMSEIDLALRAPLFGSIKAATENYTELPLRFSLARQYVLSGVLDRLYKDTDGVWNVVDYKTTRRPDPDHMERYRFQTKLYAFLVFKLFDCPSVVTHLYFTATGTTVSETYTDIDLFGFEQELEETINAISVGRDAGRLADIPKQRSHCSSCQYGAEAAGICVLDPLPISIS
jgi:ATP-dependent exoDNAse (exonuclease V) beta subunit